MSLTQREAFARLMAHLCTHDGSSGHGYSQPHRMGNGTTESVDLGDGVTVTTPGGDRDCSSAIVTSLRAVGVDTYGASYTGNMRSQLLRSGLFSWHQMGDGYIAQRGDIYLNETHHTAMCVSANPDMLAQFRISERGTIDGATGDQTGRESEVRSYYSYPWDGKLAWRNDGETIGSVSGTQQNTAQGLGDTRYTGPLMVSEWQRQLGTPVDGVISGQYWGNKYYLLNFDRACIEFGAGGSQMVTRLQRLIGVTADGYLGPDTVKSLQTWLNGHGFTLDVDGYYGPATSVAVGSCLTKGAFRA